MLINVTTFELTKSPRNTADNHITLLPFDTINQPTVINITESNSENYHAPTSPTVEKKRKAKLQQINQLLTKQFIVKILTQRKKDEITAEMIILPHMVNIIIKNIY